MEKEGFSKDDNERIREFLFEKLDNVLDDSFKYQKLHKLDRRYEVSWKFRNFIELAMIEYMDDTNLDELYELANDMNWYLPKVEEEYNTDE